ncbi:unnamed protein product [Caenorhabditis bovis]|uniref:Uncharacterized protein n=1 Tax=Caenorhabditis bovis TaxID=2654633 RepID=A0A8S1F6G2_9PELO|nr:unnamed protein product [Caenorhabditis bovis]
MLKRCSTIASLFPDDSSECPASTTLVRQLYLPSLSTSASFAVPSSSSTTSLPPAPPPLLGAQQHSASSSSLINTIHGHRNPALGSTSTLTRSYHQPSSATSSTANLYSNQGGNQAQYYLPMSSSTVLNNSSSSPSSSFQQPSSQHLNYYSNCDQPTANAFEHQRRLGGSQQHLYHNNANNQAIVAQPLSASRPNYTYQQQQPPAVPLRHSKPSANYFGKYSDRGGSSGPFEPVAGANCVPPLRASITMIDVLAPVRDTAVAQTATTGSLPTTAAATSSSNGT